MCIILYLFYILNYPYKRSEHYIRVLLSLQAEFCHHFVIVIWIALIASFMYRSLPPPQKNPNIKPCDIKMVKLVLAH